MDKREEMKPIQLQYDLPKGATAFIMKPKQTIYSIHDGLVEFQGADGASDVEIIEEFMEYCSPLQVGDEFYIQEDYSDTSYSYYINVSNLWQKTTKEFYENSSLDKVKIDNEWHEEMLEILHDTNIGSIEYRITQMTYEQSRHKGVCVSVELKRVKDMEYAQKQSLCSWWVNREHHVRVKFSTWLDQNFGQDTYEQNPWVFVITFKEK